MTAPDHDSSSDPFEDSRVSIDELGTWLKRIRAENPSAPLIQLLEDCEVGRDMLVDLAALDLMLSWRRGYRTATEEYLRQFPLLAESESSVLDLIDAEMCIRRELKEQVDIVELTNRFPKFADPIRQLAYLDGSANHAGFSNSEPLRKPNVQPIADSQISTAAPKPISEPQSGGSSGFELERDLTIAGAGVVKPNSPFPEDGHQREDSIDVPIPIRPPDWMASAKCIASTISPLGRSWLVKGRDTNRGDFVAMKVIPFPITADALQKTRILDLCEQASNVSHPCWDAPRIAAMNRTHLAVVRPWVFGTLLSEYDHDPTRSINDRLTIYVRVAYALAAAHRTGATHGSITPSNVVIGHDGETRLIDAASSLNGWRRYFATWDNDLSKTLPRRIEIDVRSLLQLIANSFIANHRVNWIDSLCDKIDLSDSEASAALGERLQSMLDHPPESKRRWWPRPKH
ncbi:hypothetical protein LOC67_10120 [Stieleria sp. JC731]|uniref:hypothetical protein n=1 Tax=Pirellulaceae TaxID=2691357 RepID=UPI001E3D603E|nr:hypothetical protein [Stieleria sp. JC731]MCC9600922.1 hypothetical protein [Stieleria sp. JC731]